MKLRIFLFGLFLSVQCFISQAQNEPGSNALSSNDNSFIINAGLDDAYTFTQTSQVCYTDFFCMPVATLSAVANITGYNFIVQYDKNKVVPTGNITVSNDLIMPFLPSGHNAEYITDYTASIDEIAGTISIGIYFNALGGVNAVFSGSGDVCCIGFVKTVNFQSVDTAAFSFDEIIESYQSSASLFKTGTAGEFISFKEDKLHGSLKFWSDYSPIKYDTLNPNTYLITNILGCYQTANAVQPNLSGHFTYSILNGNTIDIKRDIASTTNVHSVINSQDSYFTALTSIKGTYMINWTPSVFQMIAMDVNRDGMVTAGDASQINQRAVSSIPEFSQVDNQGKDWLFIANTVLANDLHYLISASFPEDDGLGYSKYRVPVVEVCQSIPIINATTCPMIQNENYIGVLLGDVDASYKTIAPNGLIKSEATGQVPQIVIDFSKAAISNGEMQVPVTLTSDEAVNSFDFELLVNDPKAVVKSVETQFDLNLDWNYTAEAGKFSFASYSVAAIPADLAVSLIFALKNSDPITASDLSGSFALVNGKSAELVIIESQTQSAGENEEDKVLVYPNPASDKLFIEGPENSKIQLFGLKGELIMENNINAMHNQTIEVSHYSPGVYILKIFNDKFTLIRKVILSN